MTDLKARAVPALDATTLALFGCHLRGFYEETLERPLPDNLLTILQRLESPTPAACTPLTRAGTDHSEALPSAIAN